MMFQYVDFETQSTCNRVCPTCIRNSHLNKDAISSWFTVRQLPIYVIKRALSECKKLGFTGKICLSHYNEPLIDDRLPKIAKLVKSYGFYVFCNSNGDFLDEELAEELDGNLDKIIVSLYMKEPMKSERARWIRKLFHKTYVEIITMSDHIATHFSPAFDVVGLAQQNKDHPCSEAEIRVIINHRGQYLLCCDDVVGNFDLGTFPETSIQDFWYGEKHTQLALALRNSGGRTHPYCQTCPRT